MEKVTENRKTLGQAIDEITRALEPLDESTRVTAIRAVCDHLKINLNPPSGPVASLPRHGTSAAENESAPSPPTGTVTDIRTLKDQKKPSSANEMAALVAYYLAELAPLAERTSEVTKEHMEKYFKQAGFPLPKAIRQLLPNAKNAGYFDGAGEGKFRLNPVGYNLVAHNLPRSGATLQPATARRRPRRPHHARKKA